MPTYRSFGALFVTACLISTLFLAFTIVNSPVYEPTLTSRTTAYFSGVEKTWDAGADGSASGPANWNPVGVPDTGDNITFDGTSVYLCDWNVEVTLGNFSMLAGYTGTVTQTVSFGCVDFLIEDGLFTASGEWITVDGSVYVTRLKFSNNIAFEMTGTDTIGGSAATLNMGSVKINTGADVTINQGIFLSTKLEVETGATLTISATVEVYDSAISPTGFINSGTIEGASTLQFGTRLGNRVLGSLGVIDCPITFYNRPDATASRSITMGDDSELGSTFQVSSSHATYTLTVLHGDNHTLSVTGAVTLGTRGVMTQGTGAWSFGSYAQTGVSSVFNQGATLTIGGDFTVSDGIFNALGDMTVPGDWDTATGDYVNDDNVVTLTGAAKTLAMHADDSFYNVTVSGTYTMDTDTTVRLRATITGTVDGTGDFLEPAPEFTSIPWVTACPSALYEYAITQTYWDALALDSAPYWLNLYDGSLKGIPGENETGIYNISLTLTWNDMVTYQNFTLVVCAEEISPYQFASFELAIALCFCFGIMLAGFKERMLLILAGLVWMVCGIAIFIDYGDAFLYVSVGLGASLLFKGAYDVWK